MLPIERQNRIRELIQAKKSIKISELSKELAVSEMTIHRDLKPLIHEGMIIKTFGGITLAHDQKSEPYHQHCMYCNREILERMTYRIILKNNQIEVTCCAHCGLLRHHQLENAVNQAICYDFLRHTTINSQSSWYVIDTTIDIGCCQPQVLPFEWEEHAINFVKGFGGEVCSFQKATEILLERMQGNGKDCT